RPGVLPCGGTLLTKTPPLFHISPPFSRSVSGEMKGDILALLLVRGDARTNRLIPCVRKLLGSGPPLTRLSATVSRDCVWRNAVRAIPGDGPGPVLRPLGVFPNRANR